MFGANMGTLTLQAKTPTSGWTQLWTKAGQQQNTQTAAWLPAAVSISSIYNQIRFVGTTGVSWRSDMAIDDVIFVYDDAPTTTLSPPTPTTTGGGGGGPNVIDCDFEANACSWTETTPTNVGSAWTRRSGRTPSSGTGPNVDHTKGTAQGFYMYVESSRPNYPQKTFTLATPIMALATGGTISFWYHMYGSIVGELAL
jgi:hypothetical protein